MKEGVLGDDEGDGRVGDEDEGHGYVDGEGYGDLRGDKVPQEDRVHFLVEDKNHCCNKDNMQVGCRVN
jgi:hypothetical protein